LIVPPDIGIIFISTTELGSVSVYGCRLGVCAELTMKDDITPTPKSLATALRRFEYVVLFLMVGCLFALGRPVSVITPRSGALTRFTYTEYHMGVDARLVVYARDRATAQKACAAAFERIAALDTIMSDYRRDSELMKLCGRAGGPPVRVSADLFAVLLKAQEVSKRSGGGFDVTVGPLVQLWRKARKTAVLPTTAEIERARKLVGWRKVVLNRQARTVKLLVAGMKLDLGGIAKGYADDDAQKVLKKFGVTSALVEMGGDIVVSNPPPGTKGWTIRVPNAGRNKGPVDMRFANCAISTSGDTAQFAVIGGVRYSHVIDPRTGWALTNRIQATVIAKDGLTSDPLSKLLALLGPRAGSNLLKAYPGTRSYMRIVD
jgi:FAD:protein FMN transferase